MKILSLFFVLFLMLANGTKGQCPPTLLQPATPYGSTHFPNKTPLPYVHIREADVMWSKTIWRVIDLREKMNLPLYYPLEPDKECRKSLFDVLRSDLFTGEITAYGKPLLDDEFNYPLTISEVVALLKRIDTVSTQDPLTGVLKDTTIARDIVSENIKRYWLKELWFFDKQRSVMEVRIIGLCPLIEKIDQNTGEFRGYEPLFWVPYAECRPAFAKAPVLMLVANTSGKITFDELFEKRIFDSFIYKESNVYDRLVVEYAQGINALLESDAIKEELFNIEHDLWHF